MLRSLSSTVLALFLAVLSGGAHSQDSATPQATQLQGSSASTETKKPKKVLTNEDLSKSPGEISVVGDEKNKQKVIPPKPPNPQFVASLRKQLEKLQKQLDDVNKQLVDLKNFSDGEPSTTASGVKMNKRYEREPIEVQMRALQDQKKDLQSKIDALFDEARKKGVEPGELR